MVPELTDEFAAKVRPGLTKDTLLDELRKAIDAEDAKEFTPARNKALGEALAEVMDVQVPDTLVTNQAREKFAVMMSDMRANGVADDEIKRQINPENFSKYKEIVKDDIIRDFKVSMATDEIARLEGITVPDYQVEEQLQAIKKDAGDSEEFDENMIRAKVQTTMERQAVMDWLAEKSNLEVEYNDEEFDEDLMQKLADESLEREKRLSEQKSTQTEPGVVEETKSPEPVAAATEEKANLSSSSDPDASLEEKAFQALMTSGALEMHPDPSSPDYDHSQDDEFVESGANK